MKKRRFITSIGGVRDDSFIPYERQRGIPVIVYSVVLALAVWGTFTLFTVSDEPATASAGTRSGTHSGATGASDTSGRAVLSPGRELFEENCATCHQEDGIGIRGAVPPLAGSPFVTGNADVPVGIVLMGLSGPLTVDGRTFDGRMPTFRNALNDEQIARIVSFIRQAWGNDAGAVSPERVAELRQRLADRSAPLEGEADIADIADTVGHARQEAGSGDSTPIGH